MLKIEEQRTIEAMTWSELQAAFSGLRLELSDNRQARYTVRVVQQFPPSRGIGAAGESRVLRPRGGAGAVNFLMLGSQAVSHAPRGADRRTVVGNWSRDRPRRRSRVYPSACPARGHPRQSGSDEL